MAVKASLSQTLSGSRSFTNGTQADTLLKLFAIPRNYTLELVAKVNAAVGRGLDIEARNAGIQGFRLSLDAAHLKEASSLNAVTPVTVSKAAQQHTIRIAVQSDTAHIYQNGAYIQSQPLTTIKDIVGGVEADVSNLYLPGSNLAPGWAGVTGNFTGAPDSYGWAYNGIANTGLFTTANSTSGVRYMDVSASVNTHTYNGTTYNGRLLFLRWDGSDIQSTCYTLPVMLEANTTYDFSMLFAYFSNATGGTAITAGIGKTTAAADRLATHVFTASATKDLVRESFVFTSQEAGQYYLSFTGNWGLFTIGELSLNKNAPGNLVPNWAGIAPNNAGTPGNYSWAYNGTTTSLFNTANGTSGVRYTDVSSSVNTHNYNGATYNGRLLFLRWDNSAYQSACYTYPVVLEANTTYEFSMLHAYYSNATGSRTITAGIGKTTAAANRLALHVFATNGTKELTKEKFLFTSQETGVYYLTFTGDWGLFTVGELSLTKYAATPRFVLGKNYITGAVNMEITSATYEDGAYAPAALVTQTPENITVTGSMVSVLPSFNTNFIVPGKTDLHVTGAYSPLVNSTVQLNADNAWLFFDNIKPSVVVSNWLSKVSINGVSAVGNANVRIAPYKNGTAIIPNGNVASQAALQVYTQPGLSGSTASYAINTYYNSLAAWDNSIRSFKLQRGYMATLANNPDGTGYSRVFVANDSDLVVNAMPAGLDTSVSFIRVFAWDWVSKKGKAGGGTPLVLLNGTWYYDWNIGGATTSDYNYVAIRQNGGWPAWSAINSKPGVNHLLGFNEPDRPDQANMSVDEAVRQWPDLMKSGYRVGSPAPSDPFNGWVTSFLAKTDALNYRVDYVAIHCYWGGLTPQTWYSRLKSVYDQVKRPLWITEWNNGANWTTESWPTDTAAQFLKQYNDMKGILQVLDTTSFIERYAIYDWVTDKRAMVLADTLTLAGRYYAANPSNFAYSPQTAFVHNWKLVAPNIDTISNTTTYTTITLRFHDINGELGGQYILERKIDGVDTGFVGVSTYTGYVYASDLTFADTTYTKATYRVKAYNRSLDQYIYSATIDVTRSIAAASLSGEVSMARVVTDGGLPLQIYPNPATDRITVQLPVVQNNALVRVYNASGQLVKSARIQSSTTIIGLEQLPAGIYYVQVSNGKQVKTEKIVKQRGL
ncbi:hypothetical protein FLA_1340 [Filimonas lacunae]|nr:hypothetical protein FLA_1340 [Filimonas lacunae]